MNRFKWLQRIEIEPDVFTPGVFNYGPDGSDFATTRFGMPKDLTGKDVLDIGAADGLFSFEAEKRGAYVTAVDLYQGAGTSSAGFRYAKEKLNSKVNLRIDSFMGVYGEFDVVLFYGVLYHLQDPYGAFKKLRDLTKPGGLLLLETAILQQKQIVHDPNANILGFVPNWDNDPTNFFYPTEACIRTMLENVGFENVEKIYDMDDVRATFKATRLSF